MPSGDTRPCSTLLNEAGVDPKHHEDLELMNDIDLDETVESGTLVKILRQDES
jgi:hypothetical protein